MMYQPIHNKANELSDESNFLTTFMDKLERYTWEHCSQSEVELVKMLIETTWTLYLVCKYGDKNGDVSLVMSTARHI